MVFPVVKYGHPILRKKGVRVTEFTSELQEYIGNLFETMYQARGVGLASQQVGQALQICVIDVRGMKDRPSQLWLSGQEAEVDAFMPLALINPVIKPRGVPLAGPEGCLSFPEIYAEVVRPSEVDVTALNQRGESFEFRAGGLLARAVQHEVDHLNGILFIDRMDAENLGDVRAEIDALMAKTRQQLKG
jgi:peptide deformylase